MLVNYYHDAAALTARGPVDILMAAAGIRKVAIPKEDIHTVVVVVVLGCMSGKSMCYL